MRNWNKGEGPGLIEKPAVFSVPMRNWNPQRLHLLDLTFFPFSAYLWGIETSAIRRYLNRYYTFSAYLWGIETSTLNKLNKTKLKFSAYLWGIETIKFINPRQNAWLRFQRTYEELKPCCHFLVSRDLLVFSVPMRNWNYHLLRGYHWNAIGFQRTYEELKLRVPGFRAGGVAPVFSVPMRNWNTTLNFLVDMFSIVFSVPMRNWNRYSELEGAKGLPGFQRTYEELKRAAFIILSEGLGFSAYLWGIETHDPAPGLRRQLCFQRTYEELKLKVVSAV